MIKLHAVLGIGMVNMHAVVVSFYTLRTPYEKEVINLMDSCARHRIQADIVGVESQGSWEKNCALKPSFILGKLRQWQRPILWVDADAVFKQSPDFADFASCDISVRMNEFLPKDHASRIVSSAIFVQHNAAAMAILEQWVQETEKGLQCQERTLEFWDQTALRDVLNRNGDAQFLPMPLKYTKIFDFDDLFISEKEVIIEHYQASRRFKNDVSSDHCCH
jgi:hypothetical protein